MKNNDGTTTNNIIKKRNVSPDINLSKSDYTQSCWGYYNNSFSSLQIIGISLFTIITLLIVFHIIIPTINYLISTVPHV